jgi:epoxyqueuosine reductase
MSDIQKSPPTLSAQHIAESNSADLKSYASSMGADAVGIADLSPLKGQLITLPSDVLNPYSFGISIAVRLSNDIIEGIKGGPTPAYAQEYSRANDQLDHIAGAIAQWINIRGFQTLVIPASKVLDSTKLLGAVSHKAIAVLAGIGWQGKSLLVIHPKWGPRMRLATILTDLPLIFDSPLKNGCGVCIACSKACPAGAIKNISTEFHYIARDDAIDLAKCYAKLREFKEMPGIGKTVCGLCIKACPWGKGKSFGKQRTKKVS